MKRTPRTQSTTSGKQPVALDPTRLCATRGGLDIAVDVVEPPAAYMSLQHNDLLITR